MCRLLYTNVRTIDFRKSGEPLQGVEGDVLGYT